ncbi:MAG: hypothetical protein HYU51_10440 [Candidatus Rokubacteria bacterium]|nr:hypothetical protein [Candidatus Rokubacteria bacterium]
MKRSLAGLRAPVVSLAAAAAFFVLARLFAEAPPLAVVGGSVWVFFLATIVTLPLLARRSGDRTDGEP